MAFTHLQAQGRTMRNTGTRDGGGEGSGQLERALSGVVLVVG